MKKTFNFAMISMLLIAGCIMFSSCKKEEKTTTNPYQEKLLGKWKLASLDGKDALTNRRGIYTFKNEGVMQTSYSYGYYWTNKEQWTYTLDGSSLQMEKQNVNESITTTISDVNDQLLCVNNTVSSLHPELNSKSEVYKKVAADYSSAIVGLWEGVSMDGEETYGSAKHRWEYKSDETYSYYDYSAETGWVVKNDGDYYVDGDWLATRWVDAESGTLLNEYWDIDSCTVDKMIWTALRERTDGSRYITTITFRKVTK